jgi:two-component system sensor histidine kinase KdpD
MPPRKNPGQKPPNPPGLRHEKRYLEVEVLLDAGIDVYTTLNIYQLESQVDTVAYLTGVTNHETVSDQFLDLAEQLEMVYLSGAFDGTGCL